MTDEAGLWRYLSNVIGNRWEAQRHEDKYSTGIPDVSYATDHHGWIELKSIKVKDEQKLIKIPHFTPAQKNWAKRFGKRGGRVWSLIRVNRHHLLLSWVSVDRIGTMNIAEMIQESSGWWENQINPDQFIDALSHHSPYPIKEL